MGLAGMLRVRPAGTRDPRLSKSGNKKKNKVMETAQNEYRSVLIGLAEKKEASASEENGDKQFWTAVVVLLKGYKFKETDPTKPGYDVARPSMSPVQPDHIWDLQLSGADNLGNLGMLGSKTNTYLGSQIDSQIKKAKLENGTIILIRKG
jgi:hypothetical protein